MKLSAKAGSYVSLTVILAYWVYKVVTANTDNKIPDSFSAFVLQVALVKIATMGSILLLLFVEGARWSELGLTTENWKKRVLSGALIGVVLFVLLNVMLSSLLSSVFPGDGSGDNPAAHLFRDPQNIYIWLLIGILGGGFVEELSRIFVLTRFEKAFHSGGLYFALICSSIIFGLGHIYQGNSTAVSTGISGLVMGLIYIRRRSTLEIVVVHAVTDILAIVAAFMLYSK